MEENKNDEGRKEDENDTQEKGPTLKNDNAGDGVEYLNDTDKKADAILNETFKQKREYMESEDGFKVTKDRFADRNEKAKLYEAHAPLLDKVLKDPALVEKLLENQSSRNHEGRLRELEEERKSEKRAEIKRAIANALTIYPEFQKDWAEIQEDVMAKIKRGISPAEAIRREYIAFRPELAQAESERIAREGLNREGELSFGGKPVDTRKINPESKLSDDEKKIFRALSGHGHMPKDEAGYAKLMDKHKDWLDSNLSDADRL